MVDISITELRAAVGELKDAVSYVRDHRGEWGMPPPGSITLPPEAQSWNFTTFEKYINQRLVDLSLQLRERYEAQQTGVTAALAAAEKAVNAALIAAEKAVDKAEGAIRDRIVVAVSDLTEMVAERARSFHGINLLRSRVWGAIRCRRPVFG